MHKYGCRQVIRALKFLSKIPCHFDRGWKAWIHFDGDQPLDYESLDGDEHGDDEYDDFWYDNEIPDDELLLDDESQFDDESQLYDELEDESRLEDDVLSNDYTIDFELEYYYHATSDQPLPAINEYVPEMLFADDMLEYIEEEEIFEQIVAVNAATAGVGSGLVQFVLEPVASSLPSGVTMAQARAAAFNASTMIHPLFTNATTNTMATAINGRFGRDAIFLGVSGNRYRVMIGEIGRAHV